MTGVELQKVLDHAGLTEEHVVGFRLANGARVMFIMEPFSIAKNMIDEIGMLYKELEDGNGNKAKSYTELNEVIQVILNVDLETDLFIRDIIE